MLTGRLGLASVSPSIVNKKAIITDDGCQDKCMTNSMYRGMETLENNLQLRKGFIRICVRTSEPHVRIHARI